MLLSDSVEHLSGGELVFFADQPESLWNTIRKREEIPSATEIRARPKHAGDTVIFQGKHIAHRVSGVGLAAEEAPTTAPGRLTLAVGLYASNVPQRWLYAGGVPDKQTVSDCWRIEAKKARLLTLLEEKRQLASWTDDP